MKLAALPLALTLGAAIAACARPTTRVVQGVPIAEEKAGLAKRATLPADSAIRIALGRVPGGRITKGEIEEENGRLIYSFDVKLEGRAGIEEVHVDARDGAVVSVEHEDDGDAADSDSDSDTDTDTDTDGTDASKAGAAARR